MSKFTDKSKLLSKSTESIISLYPNKYEITIKLKNGKELFIRPVKSTDIEMVQELHYSLDDHDIYYRFFSLGNTFSHCEIQDVVNINYTKEMVLVGEHFEDGKKKIIALGGLFRKFDPTIGELVFVTHKDWRDLGITQFLLKYLVKIGRELNFKKLGGSINLCNNPMLHILHTIEYKWTMKKINREVAVVLIDLMEDLC
ncbi:MAG: GNAT family N-acetyltransferase [Candidatus Hodarchaeota archaeon]